MEVIVITFLLIIFPRDAFLLAFKYIYIYIYMEKRVIFAVLSNSGRPLPASAALRTKGPLPTSSPVSNRSFILGAFSPPSSTFWSWCFVGCWVLSPRGGDFCCSHPRSHLWVLGDLRGPIAHRSLFRFASPLLFQCSPTILLHLEHRVPILLLAILTAVMRSGCGVTLTRSLRVSIPT